MGIDSTTFILEAEESAHGYHWTQGQYFPNMAIKK
jgi:hypothetical protein